MKFDYKSLDKEQFKFVHGTIAGEEVILITPNDITCKWTGPNMIYRSVIVTKDGKPVSLSFKKFLNLGEKPELSCFDGDIAKCNMPEKIDGCCDGDTILITDNGNKTIKEICENKFSGKVLGYDHDLGMNIFTEIISHSIKNNNNDWYELELENGEKLILTGNHEVWIPELNCYRKVENLIGNENFLIKD